MTHSLKVLACAAVMAGGVTAPAVRAHCQIPCGIYDDHLKLEKMLQDADTVIKAVNRIQALAGKQDPQSLNQLTRWVRNKEDHAESVITAISEYYLTQRVKSSQENYMERLVKHHAVIVAAMKAKQNADLEHAEALKSAIAELRAYYPEHTHENEN